MKTCADVVVIGVGGVGSAACAHLARRGVRVVGIEQFPLGHDRGSSHGDTRIIRLAYFEHPNYVPLLRRSFDLWRELERETRTALLRKTGLLISGLPSCEAIRGAQTAAELHHLTVQRLTPREVAGRFPGIVIPDEQVGLLEADAGFLAVEACVAAHQEVARQLGAQLLSSTPVRRIELDASSVRVVTEQDEFSAARLVVTAGAWTHQLLREHSLPLVPSRKVVGWFEVTPGAYHVDAGYPCFYTERPEGAFYGFPSLDGRTMKTAEHTGIDEVDDPSTYRRDCAPAELAHVGAVLVEMFPQATQRLARESTCLYTMTPDHHFIIDRLPESPQVSIGCGFSGHGFKFSTLLGEVLADLALDGRTHWPIDFLSLRRFGGNPVPLMPQAG